MKAKMKKANIFALIILVLVVLLSLTACGKTKSHKEETITITDMIGRSVEVKPGTYKRVVCIGAGALRMYSYIGDVSLLSGIEDIDNTTLDNRPKMFDQAARPYVIANKDVFDKINSSCGVGGPNAQSAEAEKILSCNPDIVVSEYEDKEKEDALQKQLGVPVITLKYGYNGVFDEYVKESLKMLGKVFNKEKEANTLISFINSQKDLINNRTKDIPDGEKKSVYICGLGNWGTTNHLFTAQNYAPFKVANIKNAVSGLAKDGIQPIEEEKLVSLGESIDIMIIDSAAIKNIKPLYNEDKTMFDTIKAWNNNEVYIEMAYNAYYTNLEIALINTWWIAKVVYPNLFSDIDMTAKTNEVTMAFLGKELATEIFACPASFGGYQKINTQTFFN